jgi:hypothetical protein
MWPRRLWSLQMKVEQASSSKLGQLWCGFALRRTRTASIPGAIEPHPPHRTLLGEISGCLAHQEGNPLNRRCPVVAHVQRRSGEGLAVGAVVVKIINDMLSYIDDVDKNPAIHDRTRMTI